MAKGNLFDPKIYQSTKGVIPVENIENCILVFDIVDFSKNMNNSIMIKKLNEIHNSIYETLDTDHYWAETDTDSSQNSLILTPTGDGYSIALSDLKSDEEIFNIARKLYVRFKNEGLNFRMGIAKGRNILKMDLNQNLNIFGYGSVLATRVCSVAKEMQILVEAKLADSLLQQKEYKEFQKIETPFEVKHSLKFNCYNYYKESEFGINS